SVRGPVVRRLFPRLPPAAAIVAVWNPVAGAPRRGCRDRAESFHGGGDRTVPPLSRRADPELRAGPEPGRGGVRAGGLLPLRRSPRAPQGNPGARGRGRSEQAVAGEGRWPGVPSDPPPRGAAA